MSGQNGEPGAQVTLALNGQIKLMSKRLSMPIGLVTELNRIIVKIGDKIIIYMADSLGNRNPILIVIQMGSSIMMRLSNQHRYLQ